MVKFVQILSLKNVLSKLITYKETLLRQTSFLASSLNQNQCLNQIHSQELQVKKNNEILRLLESKCNSLKSESQEEYFQVMEQTIQLLDQQLQLINKIMKKQNIRNQIKYSSLRSNILEKAANHFYEIWQFDSENMDYLQKYLDIVKCFKGTLCDQYLEGLCKYAQYTQDYEELANIYSQLEMNKFSETQKRCAMTLFMLTQDELYYEHFLLNESNLVDQSFEIRFHLFATQYFQQQNCYHTTKFHKQQCEDMSSEYQRSIAKSNLELQLSFMKNQSNH
ncbi:unnamed protein product (macronuclear) [Paramecium tetraurelia]|uniref:14-3-3 domain-containing protein n=1 Tax=Paramecium tetraurelia TaxID=5888 RepID=A0D0E5_PARTE|nr:uncharacterized protein GSPATT00012064001 [Paramecium tetraurelia]CAK76512.1 unnamed protein product [Paramecium tetraurelia]|eukprot:XP_001443909.1 hypothetical protein (macronuclear) [Paramecium tetraurelia strain d4-2]